jgi:hypothetical protein
MMGVDPLGATPPPMAAPAQGCTNCPPLQRPDVAPSSAPVVPQFGFVYAVGRIATRFPTLGVEKEFIQLIGSAQTTALVEVDQLKAVLSEPNNRYLGRHLCWVFVTQHVDAFMIVARDATEITQLVDALAPSNDENVIQAVVGAAADGSLAAPGCPGLGLPAVAAEQLLSFTLDEFIDALPRDDRDGEPVDDAAARAVVRDLFVRLTLRADNRGIADEHRALNYLALRYPPVYHMTTQALNEGKTLVGVDARHAHSSGRRLVAVRLVFRSRRTELVERYQCLVDVTDLFPFLVSPLSPTYD